MDVFEAIFTRRTCREFVSQEIPDWKLEKILEASKWYASPDNTLNLRFIVVKDQEMKDLLGEMARGSAMTWFGITQSYDITAGRLYYLPPKARPSVVEKMYDGSLFNFHKVADVSILCCYGRGHHDFPKFMGTPAAEGWGYFSMISLGTAAQNICLSATALGIGSVISGFPVGDDRDREYIKEALGIPPAWEVPIVIALGIEAVSRKIGPFRAPLESQVYVERWGRPYKRLAFRK
jgi:nitroreductase